MNRLTVGGEAVQTRRAHPTLAELSVDGALLGGLAPPRFPAALALAEQRYLAALRAGDSAAQAAARDRFEAALIQLHDSDRTQLAQLAGVAGARAERELRRARAIVAGALVQALREERHRAMPDRAASARSAPDPTRGELRHRDDIQGLRAVAVLLVALAHAGVAALAGGFIGVDVFFVLSGFLITGLLVAEAHRRHWVSLVDFYLRRARRILPAATLTLLVTDVAAYHLLNVVRARQYLQDSLSGALFFANVHFAAQGTDYFAQGQPPSPVQHFWSLSVEEQFYVIWPLLFILALGLAVRRAGQRPAVIRQLAQRRVLAVIAVLSIASLAWSVHDTAAHRAAAYFSTPARVWELGLGAALALGAGSIARWPGRLVTALGWLGLAAIAAAAALFSDATPFPGVAALVPTVGAAMVIAAGVRAERARGAVGRLLSLAPLRYVGDRSYAFYLWHWPVLVIAEQRAGHALSVAVKLALLAGAFALSVVSYAVYERPLRFARFTRGPQATVLWAASVLAVLALVSTWVASIDGRTAAVQASLDSLRTPALTFTPPPPRRARGVSTAGGAAAAGQELPAVIAAVNLQARDDRIPAPLTPPVVSLLGDVPQISAACVAHDAETSSTLCRLGSATAARTVVLVGDSHAEVWLHDLSAYAASRSLALVPVIKSGCEPVDWSGAAGSAECHTWFRWAVAQIKALHPAYGVVTGYYNWAGQGDSDNATSGLGAVVSEVRSARTKFVVLGDVPERARQPVDCLLAAHATASSCTDTLSPDYAQLSAAAQQVAAADDAAFVDPTGWFCHTGQCPLVVGHLIAYRDANHVSQTYAGALRGVFGAALDSALGLLPRTRSG